MKKSRSKNKMAAEPVQSFTGSGQAASAPPVSAPNQPATPPAAVEATGGNGIATVIQAKIDVGFGNHLYIRGGGAGLSWGEGTPLECVDPETWIWRGADISGPFDFKLLINDQNWCIGANYQAQPGATMQVIPHFC